VVEVPITLIGGLPVIVEVHWWQCYEGDWDASIDAVYWRKRDGSKGAPFSEKLLDSIATRNQWWEADAIEAASEYLAYEQFQREQLEKARAMAGGRFYPDAVRAVFNAMNKGTFLLSTP
jgi:hypothetical protein